MDPVPGWKVPAKLVWGVGPHTKLGTYPGSCLHWEGNGELLKMVMCLLCLIHLNTTSTGVWDHSLVLCLQAALSQIPLGYESVPYFLSVARA